MTTANPTSIRVVFYLLITVLLAVTGLCTIQAQVMEGQRHLIIQLYRDAYKTHPHPPAKPAHAYNGPMGS